MAVKKRKSAGSNEEKSKRQKSEDVIERQKSEDVIERQKSEGVTEATESTIPDEADSDAEDAATQRETESLLLKDPYLLGEREEFRSSRSLWTNRQRTLVLATRGITAQHRHLMEDFLRLMPHAKKDTKWDKSVSFDEIPEAAELANCNNVLFFEARKSHDCWVWLCRCPSGPSVRFQLLNVHTSGSVNFLGNNLMYSRPLLVFDENFSSETHLKLIREMFVQMVGTPRNHPKAKPFHDHVVAFYWFDKKIWIRHYQIFSKVGTIRRPKLHERELIEIGPRCVLDPLRVFEGAFGGQTIWRSMSWISPSAKRRQLKIVKKKKNPKKSKKLQKMPEIKNTSRIAPF